MVNEDKLKELDGHWREVLSLAEQYGFILYAYGGTATLATHRAQLEALGEEQYLTRQKAAFGNYMD